MKRHLTGEFEKKYERKYDVEWLIFQVFISSGLLNGYIDKLNLFIFYCE